MPFLKKTLLWVFFAFAMYFGGSSIQSTSSFLQGMGFVSVVLALISLYIIYKLFWYQMSNLMTTSIVIAICLYSAYSLGIFNQLSADGIPQEEVSDVDSISAELFGVENIERKNAENAPQNNGMLSALKAWLGVNNNTAEKAYVDINPFDYPAISGYPRVISGSVLKINGLNVKLFGIDAPDVGQTCANNHGQAYYCGHEALTWLQEWIADRPVTCHILGKIERGWATGACFVDDNKYDVAASVVNAGWAVAYAKNTKMYVAYEQQAAENKRGLWQGTFYKPWDWRRIQSRKVKIKINYPTPNVTKTKKKGKFDFWGLM